MGSLIAFREKLKILYGRYDLYFRSALKFAVTLAILFSISNSAGNSSFAGNPGVILIVSLICMFMSRNAILYVIAAYTAFSIYPVSLEYFAVIVITMLIIMLLYMQFSPECAYLIGLAALACALRIAPVPAILAGIFIGPAAVIPVVCGVCMYYILAYIPAYVNALSSDGLSSMIDRLRFIIENVFYNKAMFVAIAAAVITIIAVFIIRRLKVNHVWTIAAAAGIVLDFLIRLAGRFILHTSASVPELLVSALVSGLVCLVVLFFTRSFDYRRIERVQFEDEDYYYYVKAVPKKKMTHGR